MPNFANTVPQSLGMMPTGVAHTRSVYTVKATAQLLSRSEWWVRKQFYDGLIKCHRIGGDIMIPASAIDKLLGDTQTTYEPAKDGIGAIAIERAKARRRAKTAPRKTSSSSKTRKKTDTA